MFSFCKRCGVWAKECFGIGIARDKRERSLRFLEESLELVQCVGLLTKEDAYRLVDYVYNRSSGEVHQEIGGVMVTLGALSDALDLNMEDLGEHELTRCFEKMETIKAKHKMKPKDIRGDRR